MYAQIEKRKAANPRNFNARALQLKCKNCEEDEETNTSSSAMQRAEIPDEEEKEEESLAQLKGASVQRMVMQLYSNCKASDHHSSFEEKSIVADYKNMTKHTVASEMALDYGKDLKGNTIWRFADMVDESDEEIYEIKTEQTGKDAAVVDAKFYKSLLNENCEGNWTLGTKFGERTIDGQYLTIKYYSPGSGAILYETS